MEDALSLKVAQKVFGFKFNENTKIYEKETLNGILKYIPWKSSKFTYDKNLRNAFDVKDEMNIKGFDMLLTNTLIIFKSRKGIPYGFGRVIFKKGEEPKAICECAVKAVEDADIKQQIGELQNDRWLEKHNWENKASLYEESYIKSMSLR